MYSPTGPTVSSNAEVIKRAKSLLGLSLRSKL